MKANSKLVEKDVAGFMLIGVANTALDFIIFNVFLRAIGLPKIPSNIISTSLVMCFSFIANKELVFDDKTNRKAKTPRQLGLFIVVTVFGLYVLQTLVFILLNDIWTWPLDWAYDILSLGLNKDVYDANISKLVATSVTMVWNYIGYKHIVFAGSSGKVTGR